jgi:hypothetical protein
LGPSSRAQSQQVKNDAIEAPAYASCGTVVYSHRSSGYFLEHLHPLVDAMQDAKAAGAIACINEIQVH